MKKLIILIGGIIAAFALLVVAAALVYGNLGGEPLPQIDLKNGDMWQGQSVDFGEFWETMYSRQEEGGETYAYLSAGGLFYDLGRVSHDNTLRTDSVLREDKYHGKKVYVYYERMSAETFEEHMIYIKKGVPYRIS